MKIKKTFIVEIEVDADTIHKKYPNYSFNWDTPEQFIKATANNIKFEGDTDMSKDGMKEWGYSIKIKPVKQ